MNTTPLVLRAVAVGIYSVVRVFTGKGTLARAIRTARLVNAVTAEYRVGDYEAALEKAECLKDGDRITAEYCFMTGSLLHQLGRLTEAEDRLRKGVPLEEDNRQKALVYNTLATVLMDQQRYPEAIAFFDNAGRSWPERGANHRGIAEVWLRQRRELSESLDHARQAVDIDRGATGLKQEAVDSRLGEDFAVLSWALAENSGSRAESNRIFPRRSACATRRRRRLSRRFIITSGGLTVPSAQDRKPASIFVVRWTLIAMDCWEKWRESSSKI